MNKLFLSLCFLSTSLLANEHTLLSKSQIKTINTINLVLTKSKASDAPDFIRLVSQYEVSRFMFCSEAPETKIQKLAKSKFATKVLAPLMLKHDSIGGSFWIIKKNTLEEQGNNHMIGFVGLTSLHKKVKKLVRTIDRNNYKQYMNIGVSLEPGEWGKGYAKESLCALMSAVFASKKYKHVKGLTITVNSDHTRCLATLMNGESTKQPLVYQGELALPKGFSKLVPTPARLKTLP